MLVGDREDLLDVFGSGGAENVTTRLRSMQVQGGQQEGDGADGEAELWGEQGGGGLGQEVGPLRESDTRGVLESVREAFL